MKKRAGKNRTITLSEQERAEYSRHLLRLEAPVPLKNVLNKTICQDILEAAGFLPEGFVDLLFIDPPYNLNKDFNGRKFKKSSQENYHNFLENYLRPLIKLLKPTASVYICSDYNACGAVQVFAEKHFKVRNRITWQREKGRGAKTNWKNCSEDIWFCTMSDEYTFNVEDVKLRRRVIAPYTHENGEPKDWNRTAEGDFRLTYPSNIWTDLTVPFWSMPENTDHPTQKPEKLLAKIILASSNAGNIVLDPFAGSGTTSVVAKKLGREYVGIEVDKEYCCLVEKRLEMAETDKSIQGYYDGVFWERNTFLYGKTAKSRNKKENQVTGSLFE
jgi:site-specific DNA-methyltransferase (adenine-specific)